MPTDINLTPLIINQMTSSQYSQASIPANELCFLTDENISADDIDDTNSTNKFVTASDITNWNGKQAQLVSGTNIKTINGSSLLGSGDLVISPSGVVDQTYDGTSINAQSGVAIAGAGFLTSIPSSYLQNTATGLAALTINGTATNQQAGINIGVSSMVTGIGGIALGNSSSAYEHATALGGSAIASGSQSIQIGCGHNPYDNTLQIGFYNSSDISNPIEYQLLDGSTGLIPTERMLSPITVLTGTSITLTDNSINTLTPTGNTTFTLPTITDTTVFHQILVQLNLSTVYTIDLGTTTYFGGTAPDLSATGNYNLIYEYDNALSAWVVGAVSKS